MAVSERVQFRVVPGTPLGDGLRTRTAGDTGLAFSGTAGRDLERYYRLLDWSTPTFAPNEALLLLDALKATWLDPDTADRLWAEVAAAIQYEQLDTKWDVDGATLVQRLRDDLTVFERMAVCDAIERAWLLTSGPEAMELDDALRTVGLVAREES